MDTDRSTSGRTLAGLHAFKASIEGEVIVPSDEAYDAARVVWNATADRRPAVIARCSGVTDIQTSIRFAQDNSLATAVRSGGHSLAGQSTVDDGIIIDLSLMRGVQVDPDARVATVNGGALLSELDQAAQAFGLACPVGVVSHTGVAGLSLGGGMGLLQRRFGMTVDNILAVEMVTADGQILSASEAENVDLFWGIRGAGANFGIATQFEFKLHELAPEMYRMAWVYSAERAADVFGVVDSYLDDAPVQILITLSVMRCPAVEPYPARLWDRPALVVSASHCGTKSEATEQFSALTLPGGTEIANTEMTYLDHQTMSDEEARWGRRWYAKSGFLEWVDPSLTEYCLKAVEDGPKGEGTHIGMSAWAWGGAIADTPEDAMAFTGRSGKYWIGTTVIWDEPSEDEAFMGWGRSAFGGLSPYLAAGNYVNDMVETGEDLVRRAYGDAKYERLVELKRRFDPDNFFRLNQNIKP